MISSIHLLSKLRTAGVEFYTGVPDSLLKDFCGLMCGLANPGIHITAANEGCAIALAVGAYVASGKVPLVYLQNSGIGNAVNPLLSLADPEVFGIPMLLIVGWRGEPGVPDEVQHRKQGRVTAALLDAMEIPWRILSEIDTDQEIEPIISWSLETAQSRMGPVALLVKARTFAQSATAGMKEVEHLFMSREEAIATILDTLPCDARVFATTGHISRELYELREAKGQTHTNDFLTVGSMGHCSQIALGYAMTSKTPTVVCLDGDGSTLMHMGGMTSIGTVAQSGYIHIVLNNGAHDSVGGQPTVARDISLPGIADSCKYQFVRGSLTTKEQIKEYMHEALHEVGPSFLEVLVRKGHRNDLGRPTEAPRTNLIAFTEKG